MSLFQKLLILSLFLVAVAIFHSSRAKPQEPDSLSTMMDKCYQACMLLTKFSIASGEMKSCYRNNCPAICNKQCQEDPNPQRFIDMMP